MTMFAVIAVLVVACLSFNILSQHHFRMLDEQTLSKKLQSTSTFLQSRHWNGNGRAEITTPRITGCPSGSDGGDSDLQLSWHFSEIQQLKRASILTTGAISHQQSPVYFSIAQNP
nr:MULTISPECIES: hypothetical protein [unclassified Pseudomonas]